MYTKRFLYDLLNWKSKLDSLPQTRCWLVTAISPILKVSGGSLVVETSFMHVITTTVLRNSNEDSERQHSKLSLGNLLCHQMVLIRSLAPMTKLRLIWCMFALLHMHGALFAVACPASPYGFGTRSPGTLKSMFLASQSLEAAEIDSKLSKNAIHDSASCWQILPRLKVWYLVRVNRRKHILQP